MVSLTQIPPWHPTSKLAIQHPDRLPARSRIRARVQFRADMFDDDCGFGHRLLPQQSKSLVTPSNRQAHRCQRHSAQHIKITIRRRGFSSAMIFFHAKCLRIRGNAAGSYHNNSMIWRVFSLFSFFARGSITWAFTGPSFRTPAAAFDAESTPNLARLGARTRPFSSPRVAPP